MHLNQPFKTALAPITTAFMALAMAMFSTSASAAWKLDNAASTLDFITITNQQDTELHTFKQLSGSVSDAGTAVIIVDTSSVDTGMDSRDDYVREYFFDIKNTPYATFSTSLNTAVINAMQPGNGTIMDVAGVLTMHGASKDMKMEVSVTKLQGGYISVATRKPIILNVADFGFESGLLKLMELAGLGSIVGNIPVTFNVVFAEKGN